jgi:hypothetical protein
MLNKPNLLDAQMNVSYILTKDYENKRLCRCWQNKPNLCHRYQTQFPVISINSFGWPGQTLTFARDSVILTQISVIFYCRSLI